MKCHFLPRAQHEKPKIGHKTQKILIVGEYKYQESIQRHQKPLFRHLTWVYLLEIMKCHFPPRAQHEKPKIGQNPKKYSL